jgi:hypothetical protein
MSSDRAAMESNIGASSREIDHLAEEPFWSASERIVLPSSGIAVNICRPTLSYFGKLYSELPRGLQRECDFTRLSGEFLYRTPQQIILWSGVIRKIIEQAFVQAKLSVGPLNDSVEHIDLYPADTEFLVKYLIGSDIGAIETGTVN